MSQYFNTSVNLAKELDEKDQLKDFRKEFFIPDSNTIYLDGNSLGRLPLRTKNLVSEVTEKQWGIELIESWNKHWYEKSQHLGNKIAKIIGANEDEVIVTDSTSVNLYKLAQAAIKLQKGKKKIISDVFNFPTDLYILQGIINQTEADYKLILAGSDDEITINPEELKEKIDKNTALVVLSLVAYKSSYLHDAKFITEWAHKKGALVLWDLSHAAGAIHFSLNEINADLAVGCTYKYLNGGPGSPAFLFIKKDLQEKLYSPIQGWFADNKPFNFNLNFTPAKGIKKFLAGTPPVISQMAIEPGLDLILEAGTKNIHKKSILQTAYFVFLFEQILSKYNFSLGSPVNPEKRGSHVSIKHPEAYRICQSLIYPENKTLKIIPDFREPDNIRFGIAPLYTTYGEIHKTVYRIKEILEKKEYLNFSQERKKVT